MTFFIPEICILLLATGVLLYRAVRAMRRKHNIFVSWQLLVYAVFFLVNCFELGREILYIRRGSPFPLTVERVRMLCFNYTVLGLILGDLINHARIIYERQASTHSD